MNSDSEVSEQRESDFTSEIHLAVCHHRTTLISHKQLIKIGHMTC